MADNGHPLPSADEAARWLTEADDDLLVAELIRQGAPGAAWTACFHAQQAAENSLKAVLVVSGIDFPGRLPAVACWWPLELSTGGHELPSPAITDSDETGLVASRARRH